MKLFFHFLRIQIPMKTVLLSILVGIFGVLWLITSEMIHLRLYGNAVESVLNVGKSRKLQNKHEEAEEDENYDCECEE